MIVFVLQNDDKKNISICKLLMECFPGIITDIKCETDEIDYTSVKMVVYINIKPYVKTKFDVYVIDMWCLTDEIPEAHIICKTDVYKKMNQLCYILGINLPRHKIINGKRTISYDMRQINDVLIVHDKMPIEYGISPFTNIKQAATSVFYTVF